MKRAVLILLMLSALALPLLAEINTEGMPDVDLENKDVVVYSWSELVPEKVNDWAGFRFVDYYGGNVDTIVATGD